MSSNSSRISRRRILKSVGAAAVSGGAATLLGASTAAAQQGAPAVLTNTQAGRKFRAFVKFNNNPPSVQQLTVRGLTGRQVLIRTEAAQTCYTNVDQVLLPGSIAERQDSRAPQPVIVGHGGVGIVEAIGSQVVRCQVGDLVVSNLHRSCGSCFNCLHMRADKCLSVNQTPTCDMQDGTPVVTTTGAMSELMIVQKNMPCPSSPRFLLLNSQCSPAWASDSGNRATGIDYPNINTQTVAAGTVLPNPAGGTYTAAANFVPYDPKTVITGNPNQWFNVNMFSLQPFVPCPGASGLCSTLGNASRGILRGPGLGSWNFSLVKDTPLHVLGEGGSIQFRAEFFNILNRANFAAPSPAIFAGGNSNSLAGAFSQAPNTSVAAITSTTTTSRQIQFALKVLF